MGYKFGEKGTGILRDPKSFWLDSRLIVCAVMLSLASFVGGGIFGQHDSIVAVASFLGAVSFGIWGAIGIIAGNLNMALRLGLTVLLLSEFSFIAYVFYMFYSGQAD